MAKEGGAMAEEGQRSRRDWKKEKYWEGMIRKQERSGMQVRAFCREEGVGEGLFYAWRRRVRLLQREEEVAAACRMMPVELEGVGCAEEVAIEVEASTGHRVLVWPGFDEETLRRVLRAVEGQRC